MIKHTSLKPKIHVLVRAFNEENWIRSCLTTIFAQNYPNFFVTVVDSGSEDATTRIVREFEDVKLITTADYRPGKAIMDGVRSDSESSEYLYLVSAHCLLIGTDVLSNYVATMQSDNNLAGIYGRQLPLHYTSADDTRDLLNTFGEEFRVQRLDSFFHNANSFIRMDVLEKIPFDEEIRHIEDRLWAKNVQANGWHVAYLPSAVVYHHHGLNQHGAAISFRAAGVASILRELQMSPQDMSYEHIHMRRYLAPVAVLTARRRQSDEERRLNEILNKLGNKQPIILVVNERADLNEKQFGDAIIITRRDIGVQASDSFRDFAKKILEAVEANLDTVVDAISFVDLSYCEIEIDYVDLARSSLFEQGRNGVVPAWRDFGNFWIHENGRFKELDVSFDLKGRKSPIYRSALGQGGCIRASAIRGNSNKFEIDEFITTDNVGLIRRIEID